jgi:pimeloyl-ACP methyl ester carboxylesterase
VRALLRLLRVDLERKATATHARIRATTTDVARIGGVRLNARWYREFLDHDARADLARIAVPVLAVTGEKDLQTPPDDLAVVAATVPGPVEVHLLPDVTHTLRSQPGPASLRAYREELRRPVDPRVLELVTAWCAEVTQNHRAQGRERTVDVT